MTVPERFRLLAVDDEPAILESFSAAFVSNPPSAAVLRLSELEGDLFGAPAADEPDIVFDLEVAEGGAAGLDAVKASLAAAKPFSVVFLDARMPPGPDGPATARAIRDVDQLVSIVIVTAYSDVDPTVIARNVPPEERLFYLAKPFQPAEVRQLARSLSRRWRSDAAAARPVDDDAPEAIAVKARFGALSRRERDVLQRVVAGMANKEIALALEISPRTVENYRAKVMSKMRADTLPDLVRMAMRAGLA